MKDGDIFNWGYNEEALEKKNHGNNGGTTYWCDSRIAIWNEKSGKLVDTYCVGNNNTWFSKEDIESRLVLKFIANINDLIPCQKYNFNDYDSSDCVDISHPNMSRGGFFIKDGAKKSIKKKKAVIDAHISHYEYELIYYTNQIKSLKESLLDLSEDTYVPCDKDVYIP